MIKNFSRMIGKNLFFKNYFTSKAKQLTFLPVFNFFLFHFLVLSCLSFAFSQTSFQPNYFTGNQTNNYLARSTAFNQEVARIEINVARNGEGTLPVTQVPRLRKDDVLKVRLLDEQVNGVKPDQSNWDWTFLVAYINPGRNNEREQSVSREIQFRKTGWYKEYTFIVPYDSQPIFFLYTKSKYRDKILNLVNNKSEEIRKIGEKTFELAGAYAKIGSFLNELQFVVNKSSYGLYGGYSSYGGSYGFGNTSTPFNYNTLVEQSIERLARSFNITLPTCWDGGGGYGSYGSSYGSYGGSYGSYGGSFGGSGNSYGYAVNQQLINRAQCVAKSVRLEDFDISVSRMLQQGGILVAAQLSQKYPQLTFWINLAAAAIDFIVKAFGKSPLRLVPTLVSSSDNQSTNFGFQNSYAPNNSFNSSGDASQPERVKISLFAESQPRDENFVTAYPLVVSKWQAEADPEVISLPQPVLAEPCLHTGVNVLKSTDLLTDWTADTFTKDFKLVISSANGFRKEIPLKKNVGLGGWEFNLNKEDLNSFPKIKIDLQSIVTGKRGFNEIKSPKFDLSVPVTGTWEVETESQKAFAVGDKRIVTLKNQLGNCQCLQAVIYKPSFGGQFVFEAGSKENPLLFSADGRSVSFAIDTTNFQPGQGQLELSQYGGEAASLNISLYPPPPNITNFVISTGDRQAIITGERLEQLKAVKINGKRAVVAGNNFGAPSNNQAVTGGGGMLNSQNSSTTVSHSLNYPVSSERTVVFEDPNARQLSNNISLELELDNGRIYKYPKTFGVSPARPTLVAGEAKEIEAVAVGGFKENSNNKARIPFDLTGVPVFPIQTPEISVNVQNALTDYDFKAENIQIETRIENSRIEPDDLPKVNFEVLNWMNMRLSFILSEQSQKLLGGRRLQFRIRDKTRGDSDWYTLRNTFVRIPESISVNCASRMNGKCEIKGEGIDYIGKVSVDGGKTWYPQGAATIIAQPTADGQRVAMIPQYYNKKLLQIKLMDFPAGQGLPVSNYNFVIPARGGAR